MPHSSPKESERARIALKVPAEEVRFFASGSSPKATSRAIAEVLRSLRTFFGLPEPVRAALRTDMQQRGMGSIPEYLAWLCVERHKELARDSRAAAVRQVG